MSIYLISISSRSFPHLTSSYHPSPFISPTRRAAFPPPLPPPPPPQINFPYFSLRVFLRWNFILTSGPTLLDLDDLIRICPRISPGREPYRSLALVRKIILWRFQSCSMNTSVDRPLLTRMRLLLRIISKDELLTNSVITKFRFLSDKFS